MEGDLITMRDIFVFEKTRLTETGRVTGRFRAAGIRPKFYERLRASGIQLPLRSSRPSWGSRKAQGPEVSASSDQCSSPCVGILSGSDPLSKSTFTFWQAAEKIKMFPRFNVTCR